MVKSLKFYACVLETAELLSRKQAATMPSEGNDIKRAMIGATVALLTVALHSSPADAAWYQVYSANNSCASPKTLGTRLNVNGIQHRHHASQTGWDTVVTRNTSLPLNSTAKWVSTSGNTGRSGNFSGDGSTATSNWPNGTAGSYNICYG